MDKEGMSLSAQVKLDPKIYCKLLVTGMYLSSAKTKIEKYIEKNQEIAQKIIEDEESYNLMQLYYEEHEDELIQWAEDSIVTSMEAEIACKEQGETKGHDQENY